MEILDYIKKLISFNIQFIKEYRYKQKAKDNVIFMTKIYDDTKRDLKNNLIFKIGPLRIKIVLSIVLAGIFTIIFILIKKEIFTISNEVTELNKPDITDELLIKIADVSGIKNPDIKQEKVFWTIENASFLLANSKSISLNEKQIVKIRKYFEKDDWSYEAGDFSYVSKDGRDSVGYMAPKEGGYRFRSAMCIIYLQEYKISCGWMPYR